MRCDPRAIPSSGAEGRAKRSQHQEPGRGPRTIWEHAQKRKEVRTLLDLVQHHQPAQPLQSEFRVLEPRKIGWTLEVEEGYGSLLALCQPAGQRRLPNLARPHDRGTPEPPGIPGRFISRQQTLQMGQSGSALDQTFEPLEVAEKRRYDGPAMNSRSSGHRINA
jgi:hypothetical protein